MADTDALFGLSINTDRVELRVPNEVALAELAQVAAAGVHEPHERPFLTPWTEGSAEQRAEFVIDGHHRRLQSFEIDSWHLCLAVFHDGRPIGQLGLRANNFPIVREVTTWSWLGRAHHGKGLGTHARIAGLTLAFDHLNAVDARSDVFQDNDASHAVSRKLGYQPDGISRDRRDDHVVISDRLRLPRSMWESRADGSTSARVSGFEPCRPLFGI